MNKSEEKNFRIRILKEVWRVSNLNFIQELFNFPVINFLNNFKKGEKLFYIFSKLRFLIKQKAGLPWMKIYLTTRCTMNCKHCNTFLSKFTNETHTKIMNFDEFKKDLDKLLKAVDYIQILEIVGGEPLLAKDLAKMLQYAAKKHQIKHIVLPTNCTILPSKELINAMKNKKISVQISDYRNVKNIKNGVVVKYDEFKQILSDNDIIYNNYQEKKGAKTWFTMPEIYKDKQNSTHLENQFKNCFARYCSGLTEGKLVICMPALYILRNIELIPEIKDEIINIRNYNSSKKLAKDIIKFYSKPYSQFCNYCHATKIETNLPCGEQA